jgi:hypothetical protein
VPAPTSVKTLGVTIRAIAAEKQKAQSENWAFY